MNMSIPIIAYGVFEGDVDNITRLYVDFNSGIKTELDWPGMFHCFCAQLFDTELHSALKSNTAFIFFFL